jgi:transcriptional regulator with XRE-family HTH domain
MADRRNKPLVWLRGEVNTPPFSQPARTQAALAERLGSSQSRIAKMEAADRSVSLDLIIRSLLNIGATASDIAKWIKRAETARAA